MENRLEHLFSAQSEAYRAHRPTYDAALFAWLAERAPATALAWDCGCGSGQATGDLARRFARVAATDINAEQLAQAPVMPNVDYRRERAEAVSLADTSVDLTFVGQALHWFDVDRFYDEVRRVSKPGALLAVLSYNVCTITPELDALVWRLYRDVVGPYWAAERKHVETGYRDLPFPFETIEAPTAMLTASWDLARLLGYLQSWSAVASYRQATGNDPVEAMREAFARAWGAPESQRVVAWPLTVKVGRVETRGR
jgi:SAM-dependent methyltransferase